MPTHQGTSQTDITIGGGGGRSITLDARIEFEATYGTTANFQYKNNTPGANNENSEYEIKVLNGAGATIATWSAKYTADPVLGSATNVTGTRTNTFTPTPNGNTPTFPLSPATFASRDWVISSTHGGSTFAGFDCHWEFASTVVSGGSVTQTINAQNNNTLDITLSYSDGAGVILTVDVICFATATAVGGGLSLGSPSVSDTIQP